MIEAGIHKENLLLRISFFLFLALLIITQALTFIFVNMSFIDTDQPLMWLGASDFSKGIFTEPRFYGQNYNTFMEGLFAVPLLWLDVPVYYAVPAATHLIFLFPYLFTATYLFRNGMRTAALLILAILLCLPAAYNIMNALPRGFVTSVFFGSFFVLSILQPKDLRFTALNTILSVLGYFVNPASALATVPALFFIFLHNLRERKYYLVSALCLLTALPLHLFFNGFYLRHPDYVVLPLMTSFSISGFWDNLLNLPQAFVHLSFFSEQTTIPIIAVLLGMPFLLYRHSKEAFYAFVLLLVLIIFSCISGKTQEGSDWAYYSFSRMYLAVPFVLCLFTIFIPIKKTIMSWIVFIALTFTAIKFTTLKGELDKHLSSSRSICVSLMPLDGALHAIDFYKNICLSNGTDEFLISNGFWLSSILAYGGPAVAEDFPNTQETNSERRYLVKEAAKTKIVKKFVLISAKSDLDKVISMEHFKMKRLDDYGLFLITENDLTMAEFATLVKKSEEAL